MSGLEATELRVPHRSVLAVLLTVDGLLISLHLVSQWLRFNGERVFGRAFEATELLDLDAEVSIPTWWQQLVVFAAALLAFAVSRLDRPEVARDRKHWIGLAVVLLVVSIDEGSEIHERLIAPMRRAFDVTGGPLWFAWLIPASAVLALFGALFVRFWLRLDGSVRARLAVGGGLYLIGAAGFEMGAGMYESSRGVQDFGYSLVIACEEGFELLGQTVIVHALLTMLRRSVGPGGLTLRLDDVRGAR